jgi:hypothetical protein
VLQRVRVQRSRLRGQRILRVPRLSSELFVVAVPGIRLAKSPSHTRPRSSPEVPMGTRAQPHGGGPAKFEIDPKPYGPGPDEIIIMAEPECRRGVIRSDIRPHASGLGVTTSAARLVQIMVTPHGADRAALPALSPPRSARLSPKPGRAPCISLEYAGC